MDDDLHEMGESVKKELRACFPLPVIAFFPLYPGSRLALFR